MAISSRFAFVGDLVLPKTGSKRPFYKDFEITRNGKTYPALSMNFGVKASDSNMAFVECFDSKQPVIKTMSTDNDKIEIDWADRNSEDVIATVANYRKYVVDLGEEYGGRQEFITAFDFMQCLHSCLTQYKGRILAMGQYAKDWYEGKNGGQFYDHFKLQNVFAAKEDAKNRLSLTMDLYYNKDSVDDTDWTTEKKIILNAYMPQYINKDEGTKYLPQTLVFSGEKYDSENEKHKKLLEYKLSYVKTKSKTMVHIPWEVVLLRGAEEAEFTADMLTPAQKVQVELGVKKIEDFKPRGTILGDRIVEYRLFDPRLTGDFADGVVDTELSYAEFEESVYVPAQDEKLDDVIAKAKKSTKKGDKPTFDTEKDDGVSDDDLF